MHNEICLQKDCWAKLKRQFRKMAKNHDKGKVSRHCIGPMFSPYSFCFLIGGFNFVCSFGSVIVLISFASGVFSSLRIGTMKLLDLDVTLNNWFSSFVVSFGIVYGVRAPLPFSLQRLCTLKWDALEGLHKGKMYCDPQGVDIRSPGSTFSTWIQQILGLSTQKTTHDLDVYTLNN